jgi:hypothetical protein
MPPNRRAGAWKTRSARYGAQKSAMPSLFRFLVIVGLLGGLAYAGIFSLAELVEPQPRQMTVTISPDKMLKNH